MDLKDYDTKWSKSEKDKHDIAYVKLKKKVQMNLFTKQKQIHRYRKQTYGYQRRKGMRNKLGVWD